MALTKGFDCLFVSVAESEADRFADIVRSNVLAYGGIADAAPSLCLHGQLRKFDARPSIFLAVYVSFGKASHILAFGHRGVLHPYNALAVAIIMSVTRLCKRAFENWYGVGDQVD